jgi:serpin B
LLNEVYHDAFVAVDETGTEAAAAATGGVAIAESSSLTPFDLRFDRPFLFCICDRRTDTIVFLGRVVDAGAAQ